MNLHILKEALSKIKLPEGPKSHFGVVFPIFKKILPIIPFAISFLILYSLYPASFESTWKGRTFYLFFLWLIALETILNWEELSTEKWRLKSAKTVFTILACSLPIVYVVVANFLGLNALIVDVSTQMKIGGLTDPGDIAFFANLMPLSIEYLVFAVLFVLMLLVAYEVSYLRKYSLSAVFLGLIGFIYMSDNLYPNGKWTPLQFPVFPTTNLAASVLNRMGFETTILIRQPTSTHGLMPYLLVQDPLDPVHRWAGFLIGWPCAGVESLLIYSITILLFLSKSSIPLKLKIVYFAFGAVVTYVINILRIVTIFTIAINGGDWASFHDYYGQLYSISWIIFYPLILMGITLLWTRAKERRANARVTPIVVPR
jgi:exosortase/archaeosortase family protein